MSAHLSVTDPNSKISWECSLDHDEFEKVKAYCKEAPPCHNAIFGSCIPIRLNKHFFEDLFLPNTLKLVFRLDHLMRFFFEALATLFWDIISFPMRGATLLPWTLWNCSKGETPLHKFLKEKRCAQHILNQEWIFAKLEAKIPHHEEKKWLEYHSFSWSSIKGGLREEMNDAGSDKHYVLKGRVNFIDMPYSKRK